MQAQRMLTRHSTHIQHLDIKNLNLTTPHSVSLLSGLTRLESLELRRHTDGDAQLFQAIAGVRTLPVWCWLEDLVGPEAAIIINTITTVSRTGSRWLLKTTSTISNNSNSPTR